MYHELGPGFQPQHQNQRQVDFFFLTVDTGQYRSIFALHAKVLGSVSSSEKANMQKQKQKTKQKNTSHKFEPIT